jgi:hypothetical protein
LNASSDSGLPAPESRPPPRVPRPLWPLWSLAAVAFGFGMRLLFGALPLESTNGVMSLGFVVGTPVVIGAITALGAPTRPASWWFCTLMPCVNVALALSACALARLEGTICLVLMGPVFVSLAMAGGLATAIALHYARGTPIGGVVLLPLALLLAENFMPLQARDMEVRRSVEVAAPPAVVWEQILSARAIQPEELPASFVHAIGVPRPVEGVNVQTPSGEVRYSKWERGVHFRARVVSRIEQRSIRWLYEFDPDSFPPGTMDEHVAIGGRYFKLHDTTFNLQPRPGGYTHLEIVAHYTVASTLNPYAVPAADFLGRDFVDTILGLYKGRSERVAMASGTSARAP